MNNDSIKQGAYYLLRGGTLLSDPCKKCGNLQIKFKGEIICMACKNDKVSTNTEDKARVSNIPLEKDTKSIEYDRTLESKITNSSAQMQVLLEEIELGVIRNLSMVSSKLSTTSDLNEYQNIGRIVEQSLRIIKLLKDFRQV